MGGGCDGCMTSRHGVQRPSARGGSGQTDRPGSLVDGQLHPAGHRLGAGGRAPARGGLAHGMERDPTAPAELAGDPDRLVPKRCSEIPAPPLKKPDGECKSPTDAVWMRFSGRENRAKIICW
jgi:hypothetical protein